MLGIVIMHTDPALREPLTGMLPVRFLQTDNVHMRLMLLQKQQEFVHEARGQASAIPRQRMNALATGAAASRLQAGKFRAGRMIRGVTGRLSAT